MDKYVGEISPSELQEVCFQHERYKRITIADAKKAEELLNILMGSATEPRKKFIYENATELGFQFD